MGSPEFHGVEHLEGIRGLKDAEDAIVRGQEVACWIQKTLEESPDAQSLLHLMVEQEALRAKAETLISNIQNPKEKTPKAVGRYTRGKLGEKNLILKNEI